MRVLVGVDGSERAADAVALALRLAPGGPLTVASVFEYDDTRAANREYRDAMQARAQLDVRAVARSLRAIGREAATKVVAGDSAAHGLQALAAADGAELLVVGSSHVGRRGRVVPGSTAERLLHGAPCPVAVAPLGYRDAAQPIATVGLAWDGSPEAGAALGLAVAFARDLGASLRVVRIADTLEHADAVLEVALRGVPPDVPAEPVALTGDPTEELAALSGDLDLLVTGSRAYGPLRAMLVGATSGRLLRAAACPVVVAPRGIRRSPQPA